MNATWKVYKPKSEGISLFNWLTTNDLDYCYKRNEAMTDQVYEVQGTKIIYENCEAKFYIFQNVVNKCQCEQRCHSSILINNLLSEANKRMKSICNLIDTVCSSITSYDQASVTKLISNCKYLTYVFNSSRVFIDAI